jgi:nucleotide-binding universal stress UspA family protein
MTKRIVTGMDGSESSAVALRWAVEEAAVHGAALTAVLVWSYLDQHHADPHAPFDPHYGADQARDVLAGWVTEAVGTDASQVDLRVTCDLPAPGLVQAADAADLIVVGARGRGGFEGLLLGSVSHHVVESAHQPVAVVRTPGPVRDGRVVVGIDGSTRSAQALRWAAAEARARGTRLDVVHAWQLQALAASPWGPGVPDMEAVEGGARETLDAALADPALEGVDVQGHLVSGGASRAIIEQADGAGLIVTGSRGLGRVTSALLGSVTRQLLHHAPCPVVVT